MPRSGEIKVTMTGPGFLDTPRELRNQIIELKEKLSEQEQLLTDLTGAIGDCQGDIQHLLNGLEHLHDQRKGEGHE
jgi:uncharacterized coiled-coil protein SlyX